MEKKTRSFFAAFAPVVLGGTMFLLQGCGDDAARSLADSLSNLSQLPDAEDMVAGSGANGSSAAQLATLPNYLRLGLNLQSVSGTPPTILSLTSSNADTYFWNGLVAAINTAGSATVSQRNQFWGQDTSTPGPGGHGACMMAQSVGESLQRMREAASTMCYMKGMVSASSGVTVTGAAQSDAFNQGADDKLVRVDVTNAPMDRSSGRPTGSFNVFFKVFGTNSVTSEVYKYDMWMCNSGTAGEIETLTVNKTTGEMTSTRTSSRSGRSGGRPTYTSSDALTAYLTVDGSGNISFDRSRSRTATSTHSGGWGNFKGQIEVTGSDLIYARRYFSGTWGVDKNYSLSAFGGTSFSDFKFLQAAYKGKSDPSGPTTAHEYDGVTEYRDTFYASVASSDLSAEVDEFNMDTDTFLSSFSAPTFSIGSYTCSDTPDVTVSMDFADTAVAAVGTECNNESTRIDYEMCNSTAVQNAMNRVFAR